MRWILLLALSLSPLAFSSAQAPALRTAAVLGGVAYEPATKDWLGRVAAAGGSATQERKAAVNGWVKDTATIPRDLFWRVNLHAGDQLAAGMVPLYRGDGATDQGFATDANTLLGYATVVAATDVVTVSTTYGVHGLAVNDLVFFTSTGTLPAGLTAQTNYYVLTVPSTTTLTVSATLGGARLDLTDTGSGTHFIYRPQTQFVAADFVASGLQGGLEPNVGHYYGSGFAVPLKNLGTGFNPATASLTTGGCGYWHTGNIVATLSGNAVYAAGGINFPWPYVSSDNATQIKAYWGSFGAADYLTPAATYSNGWLFHSRTGATAATTLSRNGTVLATSSGTSGVTTQSGELALLASSVTGSGGYAITKAMDATQRATLYTAFLNFQTTLGRANVGVRKYLCHGDSNTYGYGLTDPATQCWPAQLLGLWPDGGVNQGKFVNAGISGCYLGAVGSSNTGRGALMATTGAVRAHKADGTFYTKTVLFFALGTNDLGAGTTAVNLKLASDEYLGAALSTYGMKRVVFNIAQRADSNWDGTKEAQRMAFNSAFESDTSKYEVFVNLSTLLGDPAGAGSGNFQADKLHYSLAGHQAIAAEVVRLVNPVTVWQRSPSTLRYADASSPSTQHSAPRAQTAHF